MDSTNADGYVFISYSTENQSFADSIRILLQESGIRTWMAPGDIPAGSIYAQVINQAIRECSCFILLLSEDSQKSPWVAKETERAVNYGMPIIPVQLGKVVLNDVFEFFISTNQIVAVNKIDRDAPEIQRLLAAAKLYVGAAAKKDPPAGNGNGGSAGDGSLPGRADAGTPGTRRKYANGDVYEGDLVDGRREGKGTIRYANGDMYEGEWKDNRRNGYGRFTFASGAVYEGNFVNGNYNGHGRFRFADGTVYDGEWKDGQYSGHGRLECADGDVYEGYFEKGVYSGHGRIEYASGNIYVGEYRNGKRNGHGRLEFTSGNVYEGNFVNGDYCGHGRFAFVSGTVYEGEWSANKYNGYGRIRYANGDVYEGEWKDGKRDGRGCIRYADGTVYEGEWENDEPCESGGGEADGAGEGTQEDNCAPEPRVTTGIVWKMAEKILRENYGIDRERQSRILRSLKGDVHRDAARLYALLDSDSIYMACSELAKCLSHKKTEDDLLLVAAFYFYLCKKPGIYSENDRICADFKGYMDRYGCAEAFAEVVGENQRREY